MEKDEEFKLAWSAPEYEEKERSQDWFWALGIIVVTGSIAAIIFENYFFAFLIILGGFLLGFFAKKKPDMLQYELNEKGVQIGDRIYPYETIKAYWIQVDFTPDSKVKPILFVHSERAFMPVISIPINNDIAENIYTAMSTHEIAEVEMKEHLSEKIMDFLGF